LGLLGLLWSVFALAGRSPHLPFCALRAEASVSGWLHRSSRYALLDRQDALPEAPAQAYRAGHTDSADIAQESESLIWIAVNLGAHPGSAQYMRARKKQIQFSLVLASATKGAHKDVALLKPQRFDGIDLGSAPGGQPARQQRYRHQQHRDDREGERVR